MSWQHELYQRAREVLVGGVSAGGRYHHGLQGPLYIEKASGARLWSVEGKEYIDLHNASGAAFFGYDHPRIKEAAKKAFKLGFFINHETRYHIQLAELLHDSIPSAETVRLSNTGTEATMAAIRLARAYTGRSKIVKFEGHFHGMHELIWYNHSSIGTIGTHGLIEAKPDTAGIPSSFHQEVIVLPFNDTSAFVDAMQEYGSQVAAVIMEPISYNCGCMPAKKSFLRTVRDICSEKGVVLVFDEVLSGFRMSLGGAQEYYGITPDLTTLAKALGGGFPIAALVGKAEIMKNLNPCGSVIMSGTYTGSLMSVMVAIECLTMMREPGFYEKLNALSEYFYREINNLLDKYEIQAHVRGIGARFGFFAGITNPDDDYDFRRIAAKFSPQLYRRFIQLAVQNGVYIHDNGSRLVPHHAGITAAHTKDDLDMCLSKLETVFTALAKEACD